MSRPLYELLDDARTVRLAATRLREGAKILPPSSAEITLVVGALAELLEAVLERERAAVLASGGGR